MDSKTWAFAKLINEQQIERYKKDYPNLDAEKECHVNVIHGSKYTKIDVGSSGKYMIENSTGNIYGIKAYGVIQRGHQYGTLDTINDYDWSGYTAVHIGTKEQIMTVDTPDAIVSINEIPKDVRRQIRLNRAQRGYESRVRRGIKTVSYL